MFEEEKNETMKDNEIAEEEKKCYYHEQVKRVNTPKPKLTMHSNKALLSKSLTKS